MEEQMTPTQYTRLAEWLKTHGHTAEEVLECVAYIASGKDDKGRELAQPSKAD